MGVLLLLGILMETNCYSADSLLPADFVYEAATSFRHPRRVQNIVPGDFTHSGKLDLLVMSDSPSNNQLEMTLYSAPISGGFDVQNPLTVPPSTLSQPIPIDANGDLKIDLLGVTPSSQGNSKAPFQLWQNVWNASQPNSPLFEVVTPAFHGPQCTLANPHSNAVVDLNGDCLADVFLVCDDGRGGRTFQIWVNNKEDGFSLAQEGSLPSGLQTISFADIDTGVKRGIRTCRPPDDLCTGDPNFKFNLTNAPDNDLFVRFPLSALYPDAVALLAMDTTYTPSIPLSLKLGDANLDGFPDILLIIVSGKDHVPTGVVGCQPNGTGRRGWIPAQKGADPLSTVTDARSASFLDVDEDRTGRAGYGNVLFVQNNFYYDAFFLKAIVLNGACGNGWCYSPNDSERYHPFGVSYSGASYKYTVLDTSGHRSAAQVGQLPQTSYHALQTPYSFFGLGRTNNYIENLFVGSTLHAKEHYINMEGVIPNSKVVILPSANEDEAWKRELFLRPGEWIPWVTVTVVVGTALLAIIVFVLHLNEKREDELERRRASHHINFDAL
ncbi:hypothetical protein H0H92_012014 [Tricholoma furcatifolium]|nr:hypothetical protein H0H92_012014 [Tricholoma furcatifolium]